MATSARACVKMTSRLKKNRAKRGHVSAGQGRIGKHRKHPGGCGNAGGQHHHRIEFNKFHANYFGKVGMRYFHKTLQKFHWPVINLERIWTLVSDHVLVKNFSDKNKIPVIDVTKYSFHKVLGKGCLSSKPFVIKTKNLSKLAEKKINNSGGAVLLIA